MPVFQKIPPSLFIKLFNFYPPFLGAGIKIKSPKNDYTAFNISMKLRMYNQNYVGTHFGGSLYSMCDPFYMIILMNLLGKDYLVWDKKGSIEYLKPGKGRVHAKFRIAAEEVQYIKDQVEAGQPYLPEFEVEILDQQNEVVAKVQKTLWVAKKRKKSK